MRFAEAETIKFVDRRTPLRICDYSRQSQNSLSDQSSSVGESHPHALPEPDVSLLAHPAPIMTALSKKSCSFLTVPAALYLTKYLKYLLG